MSQASKQLLIDLINEFIKANGNREITGDAMNYTLKQIVSEAEISEVALNSKIDALSSSVIVFPKDASVTEAHINRVIVNDGGVAKLSSLSPEIPAVLGEWRIEGTELPTPPTRASFTYELTSNPIDGQTLLIYNVNWIVGTITIFFKDTPATNEVQIGVDATATASNLLTWMNTNYPEYDCEIFGTTGIKLYARFWGEKGNAYDLSTSTGSFTLTIVDLAADNSFNQPGIVGSYIDNSYFPNNYNSILFGEVFDTTTMPSIAGIGFSFDFILNGNLVTIAFPVTTEDYATILAAFWNYIFSIYSPGLFAASKSQVGANWGVDVNQLTASPYVTFQINWVYLVNSMNTTSTIQNPAPLIPTMVKQIVLGTLIGVDGSNAIISAASVIRMVLSSISAPVVFDPVNPQLSESRLLITYDEGFVSSINGLPESASSSGIYLALEEGSPGDTILAARAFFFH